MGYIRPRVITLKDIEDARKRIEGAVYYSPCQPSIPLSEITGMEIFCKLDNLQRTGSFKERGARNALAQLPPEQQKRGVIAASAGNHAQALAYQGRLLGIPATVVMPKYAPLIKIGNCQKLGATVVLHGKDFAEAKAHAHSIGEERGLAYIDGYDDPAIIAGQGTMGLEIVEQVPDLDAVVVPVGGGGLLAGVALAVKSLRPKVRIIAVEADHVASFSAALRAGKPVRIDSSRRWRTVSPSRRSGETLSRSPRPGWIAPLPSRRNRSPFPSCASLNWKKAWSRARPPRHSPPACPASFPSWHGKRVVLLLCGGNIDPNVLSRVIERGLVADGRLCRFTAVISDRPGGLADLARQIASTGASIKQVVHDRAFAGSDVSAVHVLCTVETRNQQHLAELRARLKEHGVETFDSK